MMYAISFPYPGEMLFIHQLDANYKTTNIYICWNDFFIFALKGLHIDTVIETG